MEEIKTTLVVTPRDRFSTAEKCLNNLLKHTPEPFDLIVVMGGCPEFIQKKLNEKFSSKARFIFEKEFLNTAQARNKALALVRTRLAIFVDTDVFVRPGWYEPLLQCQNETGADMVGPLVLDRQNLVHAGGNSLFVTHENGKAYATMEIRYANQIVGQDTNICRQESDFIEVHCQLVVTEMAKKLGIYDENLREFHEMDSGLTLTRAGCKIMFEPRSMVYLYYTDRLNKVEDVRIFCWKWDMAALHSGFDYFKKKWGYDLNHRGKYGEYFVFVNHRCGRFARWWPSGLSLALDKMRYRFFTLFRY